MQREIKFRTWDTQNKEFSEWTNRDPHFSTSNGKIFFWERTRNENGSYSGDIILEDLEDRFILQQFTGLKDKNNKEIFEGDILEGDGERIILIESILDFYFDSSHAFNLMDGNKRFKIIGNIFERPKLTKE